MRVCDTWHWGIVCAFLASPNFALREKVVARQNWRMDPKLCDSAVLNFTMLWNQIIHRHQFFATNNPRSPVRAASQTFDRLRLRLVSVDPGVGKLPADGMKQKIGGSLKGGGTIKVPSTPQAAVRQVVPGGSRTFV